MAIQDLANNPIASGSTSLMLGYVEPPAAEELLPLDMYRFILGPIRREDSKETLFLKRYMEGPQQVWQDIQFKIFSIKDLWDITTIPDEFLVYLKDIVGWTTDLEYITDQLSYDQLRKLISNSTAIWKNRGPEDTLIGLLRLVTGARNRVWNWFDFRWVLDETELGETHEGRDPWIIDLPGEPEQDEMRSNLRIVDNLSAPLDRTLVIDLVKLFRPVGEKIEVSYIWLLDQFTGLQDTSQWDVTGSLEVEDGHAVMPAGAAATAVVSVPAGLAWYDYAAYTRFKIEDVGDSFRLLWLYTDADNYYMVDVGVDTGIVSLWRFATSGNALLAAFDFSTIGEALYEGEWYGLRVEALRDGATNQLRVYFDGTLRIDTTDSVLSVGTVAMEKPGAAGKITIDEVEVMPIPMTTELVDVNS